MKVSLVTFTLLAFAVSVAHSTVGDIAQRATREETVMNTLTNPRNADWCLHPIHLSVTEIIYSEKDRALQITSRLFIDDLELSIRAQRNESELDILEPKNGLTTQQLVVSYLTEHLKIKLDGKPCKLTFLAVEREDISLIAYIEIENVKKMKTLEVFNDAIMSTHEDQSNLVHVTFRSPVKSTRLMYNKPSEKFIFEKK